MKNNNINNNINNHIENIISFVINDISIEELNEIIIKRQNNINTGKVKFLDFEEYKIINEKL